MCVNRYWVNVCTINNTMELHSLKKVVTSVQPGLSTFTWCPTIKVAYSKLCRIPIWNTVTATACSSHSAYVLTQDAVGFIQRAANTEVTKKLDLWHVDLVMQMPHRKAPRPPPHAPHTKTQHCKTGGVIGRSGATMSSALGRARVPL